MRIIKEHISTKEHVSNALVTVVIVLASLLFVVACVTSIATWELTTQNHKLGTQNHVLAVQNKKLLNQYNAQVKIYNAQNTKLTNAGKLQLEFATNILNQNEVICTYLNMLDPHGPACPLFTLPKS